MKKFLPLAALAALAVPASAQTVAPAAPQAVAAAKASPLDKIICRTEEGLGSRLNRQRICMSVREWQDQARDSRDATEKMQQMNYGIAPSG